MRILKLVIWDLDETLLTGILEEGDDQLNPLAGKLMSQLRSIGVLQSVATQNQPEIFQAVMDKFKWSDILVQTEVGLGPKAEKVRHILDRLAINPLDTAFVDEDPFERDSMAVLVPDISAWSIAELEAYLHRNPMSGTEEGRRRPEMYIEQQARMRDETVANNYAAFLRSCNVQIKIRPYAPEDAGRVKELLTRTHRMNLGVLPVDEAIDRLNQPGEHHVVVAELKDKYGDMGRCGVVHLTPDGKRGAIIESLAISCRTRARGLSLAMVVGLLRHGEVRFQQFRCRYVFNGLNRPLRMLLMAAGFRPQAGTDELILRTDQLAQMATPDWVRLDYGPPLTTAG